MGFASGMQQERGRRFAKRTVQTLTVRKANQGGSGLTPNMEELLERLAKGETIADVADSWTVTRRMVQKTAAAMREALSAQTNEHAIAIFISQQNVVKSTNGHSPDVPLAATERIARVGAARQ